MDPLAKRLCLSGLFRQGRLEDGSWAVALQELRQADVRDSRDGFRRQPQAAEAVVPCHVADDGPEDRTERPQLVRHIRVRELPDGMGLASEASERHGSQRSRLVVRAR